MNLQQKQEAVAELAEKLRSAKALYLTDFSGLSVKRITDLRARIRGEGAEYLVVKNTLAERALDGMDLPDIGEFFRGPTGLIIATGDAVSPARVLAEFARENEDRPAVKAGIVERRAISAADVLRIASLPPRERLLAELVGAFEAPLAQLVGALEAKLNELAGLVDALRTEKEGAAGGA